MNLCNEGNLLPFYSQSHYHVAAHHKQTLENRYDLLLCVPFSTSQYVLSLAVIEMLHTAPLLHLQFALQSFTTVHLHWIKNISKSKHVEYTPSTSITVLIFLVYGVLPFCSVFIWFIFCLYFWSIEFNMLSKSVYSINETLNWC